MVWHRFTCEQRGHLWMDAENGQRVLIAGLLEPARYPHPVQHVEHRETHISHVLLAGDYAYKIKKPLDLGFLDFSRLEDRRHFCAEEIRLNARLAPEIYLDTVAFTGSARILNGRKPTAASEDRG